MPQGMVQYITIRYIVSFSETIPPCQREPPIASCELSFQAGMRNEMGYSKTPIGPCLIPYRWTEIGVENGIFVAILNPYLFCSPTERKHRNGLPATRRQRR
jgi:hypothetical protein